jgi:maltose O-acetyltransferase
MDSRVFAGALVAFSYNSFVSHIPFNSVRRLFLRCYLGALGNGSNVQMGCRFLHGRKVFLGKRNVINFGCLLDGRRFEIRTGDDVSIGPEAAILTLGHDPQSPGFADEGGEVRIGDKVWICFRATILPGISLGTGAVVAAGAVVTRDVEPYAIVAGVPAKKVGERESSLAFELNYAPFLV